MEYRRSKGFRVTHNPKTPSFLGDTMPTTTVDLKQVQNVRHRVNRRIGVKPSEDQVINALEQVDNTDEAVEQLSDLDKAVEGVREQVEDEVGRKPPEHNVKNMLQDGLNASQIVGRFINIKRVQVRVGRAEDRHVSLNEAMDSLNDTHGDVKEAIEKVRNK